MQIAQPHWIIIGIFACVGIFFLLRTMEQRRKKALNRFAAENLLGDLTRSVSTRKRRIKRFLLIGAVFCCFLALARPQYGYRWVDVKRKGIDILFAIDTSSSMLAEDITPNRLQRAKYSIIDFVNHLDGDRIGLMPFAGSSYMMCPLTIDYQAFEQALQELDTNIIPTPGTNIAQAIATAEKTLHNEANHKILIIITDGENLDGNLEQAAAKALESRMTIFTIGVGTTQGELVPIMKDGKQGFVKDKDGNFVRSRLDETALKMIAEKSGGIYAPLGDRGQGLEAIYQEKLARIPKEQIAEKRHKVLIERFPWPLGAAVILLVAEYLLGSRRGTSPLSTLTARYGRKAVPPLLLAAGLALVPLRSQASPGEEAFSEGNYIGASEYYQKALEKQANDKVLQYNLGTTSYKNNLYDEAIHHFSEALKSDDLVLQQKAYYNLGNTYFRKGEETAQSKPDQTIRDWQEALSSYDASLQLQPGVAQVKENRDLVARRLEELQQQQQQQDNQQQNEGQDDQKNGDQQKDKQQPSSDKQQDQGSEQKSSDSANQSDNGNKNQNEDKDGKQDTDSQQQEKTSPQPDSDTSGQQREETENDAEQQPPQPVASQESQTEQGNESDQTAQQVMGELTRKEAEQLLNELKNEEKTLQFVPQRSEGASPESGRNW